MGSFNPINIISSVVNGVANAISSTIEGVTKAIHVVGSAVGDAVSFVMEPVTDVIGAVMDPIAGVMTDIMSPVANVVGNIAEWAGDAIAKYGPAVIKAYIVAQTGGVAGFLVGTAIDVAETGELDLERALIRGAMQLAAGELKLPDDIPVAEQTDFMSKISDGSSFSDIMNAAKTTVSEVMDDPMAWMAKEAERQAYKYASEKFSEATGLPVTIEDLRTLKEQGPEALFDKKVEEGKASIADKTKFLEKAASGQLEPTALIENTLSSMGQPEMAEKIKFAQSMSDKIAENPEFYRDGGSMVELMKDPNVMMNLDDEQLKFAPMDMMLHVQKEDPDRFNNMLKNDPIMAGNNTQWLSNQDPKVLAEMDLDEYALDGIEAYNPDVVDALKRIKEVSTMSEEKKSALKTSRDSFFDQHLKWFTDSGSDLNDPNQRGPMQSYIEGEWNKWGRADSIGSIKEAENRYSAKGMDYDEVQRVGSAMDEAKKADPGLWEWVKSGAKSVWEGAKDFMNNPNAIKLAGALGIGVGMLVNPDATKKFFAIDQEKTKIDNLNEDAFREKITGKGPQADVRKKQMAALEAVGARARGEVPSIAKTEMEQAQDRALKQQLGAVKGMRGVAAGAKLRGLERASGAARGELAEKGSLAAAKERLAAEQQYATGLGAVRTEDVGIAKEEKRSVEEMRKLQLAERQKERAERIKAAEARRLRQRATMSAGAQALGTAIGGGKKKTEKAEGRVQDRRAVRPQSLQGMAEGAIKKGLGAIKKKFKLP